MAETDLSIVNRALQQMGARASITSFLEDSNEARAAGAIFPRAALTVLVESNWNFVRVMAPGQLLNAAILPEGWLYAYAYPSDAIVVRDLTAPVQVPPNFIHPPRPSYLLGRATLPDASTARCLFSNIPSAVITYSINLTDFNQWEPLVLNVLETLVAAKLALPLSGDKTLYQALWQLYEKALLEARLRDANEDVSRQDFAPDWLLARDCGVEFGRDKWLNL